MDRYIAIPVGGGSLRVGKQGRQLRHARFQKFSQNQNFLGCNNLNRIQIFCVEVEKIFAKPEILGQ